MTAEHDEFGKERWLEEFDPIEFEKEHLEDYVDELYAKTAERDKASREAVLSSAWSRGRRKKTDPKGVVYDLLEIRQVVHNLLKIHGIPKGTKIEIALMGNGASGMATFLDLDNFQKPCIYLDKAIYDHCDSYELLDVYCGVGLHEASHLNHTRSMFTRLKSGALKGNRAIWEGLIEDERIEEKVREESPGFAGYLHAVKRALFEKKEFGGAFATWDSPECTDLDKVCMVIFGVLRVPHLLDERVKSFTTVAGENVYESVRAILPKIPTTEKGVEKCGAALEALWNRIREQYEDLTELDEEDALEALRDAIKGLGEGGKGGKPGKGGKGGKMGKPSADGCTTPSSSKKLSKDELNALIESLDKEAEHGEETAEGGPVSSSEHSDDSDSGEGERPDRDGETTAEPPDPERDALEKELMERLAKQRRASERDAEDAKTLEALEDMMREAIRRLPKTTEEMSHKLEGGKEAALEESSKSIERIKKEEEKLFEDREGRFGLMDLERMLKRMSEVADTLDKAESMAMAEATEDRLEFHDTWMSPDGYGGSRRTLVIHPKKTPGGTRRYKEAHASVRGQVQRMRNVFRLRLGTRKHVEKELAEGQLDRRMIGRAMTTSRLFKRHWVKEDKGIALCLLMDESGSMGSAESIRYGGKAATAFQIAVLIAEALKGVPGIELEIYSYTSTGVGNEDCLVKYLYGRKQPQLATIAGYERGAENYDHMAIKVAGKMFKENTDNKNRLMIVLSDGAPCGRGYGGSQAIKATKQEVDKLRKEGIQVLNVAIEAFSSEKLFGAKHVLEFLDLNDLINKMRSLITKIVKRTTES